ncbi:uncharacterized protein LOC129587599 [Paramacrobiotus metropolitanus]|uniref:uncharacterized protein LOC129587599 n=1 Tax=Paramacrobiotus metropolitanus TaxID=2943436 RepID=UPI0024457B87|nr:uncharacterized protein LOC129587599 [Paramacrobiotus metropolitanus]
MDGDKQPTAMDVDTTVAAKKEPKDYSLLTAYPELLDLLNSLSLEATGNRVFTENMAGAFHTTGDKCLDFFASVVRSTSVSTIIDDFVEAWNEDPDKALRLLMNLRDVRGGKGEKKLPLVLLYVLSCWKPLTYLANLKYFLDLGCYKDLLIIAEFAVRLAEVRYFSRIPALQNSEIELKVMACQLRKDDEDLKKNAKAGISLCAKWAPSDNTRFNKKPLHFSRHISKTLGVTKKDYRLQLTKLRGHLRVLEKMMCNNQWDQIVFSSLPAKAHRIYRKSFQRDCNAQKKESDERKQLAARYAEYLEGLQSGKETIKSTGTQPHELVKPFMDSHGEKDLTLEGQWKDLIAKLAEAGNFRHCQAVVDVSGSMSGTPMQVAIALGLVVTELTEEPFKNKLITFHEKPTFHAVKGDTLGERVRDVMRMEWGGNTDLFAVFEILVKEAVKNPGAQMVEKLFIFSDMQFDQARGSGTWTTVYEAIEKLYKQHGFAVPKIIFWNLRDTHKSFPVEKMQVGTALVSGFSAQLMKAFLEAKEDKFDPKAIMEDVLSKYDGARVAEEERTPFPNNKPWTESLPEVEKIVEELVPKGKKSGRRRRR